MFLHNQHCNFNIMIYNMRNLKPLVQPAFIFMCTLRLILAYNEDILNTI